MKNLKQFMALLISAILLCAACSVASAADAKELTIPESVSEIQQEAFADCESAEILTILAPDAVIAEDALEGSGIKKIRCKSTAEKVIAFAEKNGLEIEFLTPNVITVWLSGGVVDAAKTDIAAFKAQYPEYASVTINVVNANEADSVTALQAKTRPDIFGFIHDQLLTLKSLKLLDPVPASREAAIRSRNAAGSVHAAEVSGKLLAYPMTADNGYFLYYDKSVIHDPSSLESILSDCQQAGKKFYMEVDSGWYQTAFFFGAGCKLEFTISETGEFAGVDIDYANENGLKAMKSLIKTIGSPAFVNGSSVPAAENWAAIVSGVWDSEGAKEYLGANYAAAKLPVIDGYQMASYGGFKMIGVVPQSNDYRSELCHALADWLTDEQAQLRRLSAAGWGPSNLAAQQNESIQENLALQALANQSVYAVPQGPIHGGYWDLASALIQEILNGEMSNASDAEIMERLTRFESDIRNLVVAE